MRTFVAALLLPCVALSEAQPACRYEGAVVVCTKDGFTRISERYLELEHALRVCNAEKTLLEKTNADTQISFEKCTEVAPVSPAVQQPQKSATAQHIGFALTILGTAAAVVTPFLADASTTVKVTLVTGGLASIGLGYVISF